MDEVIKRLKKRQDTYRDYYYCNGNAYYGFDDCYSNWYEWGRWVFIAAIIIAFIILFSLCAYLTRRRRRRGLQPYYGTAWMPFKSSRPNDGYQFQQYPQQQHYDYGPNNPPHGYPQYYAPTAAAPPYTPSPQMTGTHIPPTSPPPPPPPGSPPPPNQHGMPGVYEQRTGQTNESDYYRPPPGPPPQAHVAKI